MSQLNLNARFVGVASTDPATLLGVDPASATEPEVLRALRARLAMVESHPQGQTDEADLVREALHGAARQMFERLEASNSEAAANVPTAVNSGTDPVIDEVRALLSAPGGLNAASVARLTLLANARGSTPQSLIELAAGRSRASEPASAPAPAVAAASNTVRAAPQAPAVDQFASPADNQQETETDPSGTILRTFIVVSVIAIVIVGMAAILLVAALRDSGSTSPPILQDGVIEQGADTKVKPGPVLADAAPAEKAKPEAEKVSDGQSGAALDPNGRVREWLDVARDINACTAMAQTDAAAATAKFEALAPEVSLRWIETPADGAVAVSNSIIDLLYALARDPELALRAVRSLSAGQAGWESAVADRKAVLRAIWSSAMLSRAARERDLPVVAASEIQIALNEGLGGALTPRENTYTAGLHAALLEVPRNLPLGGTTGAADSVAGGWKAWLEAMHHAYGRDSFEYDRGVALAIERVLIEGPEPNSSRVTFDIISDLTLATSWRKDSPVRSALLRWFQSTDVSAVDLQAVTSVLATRSGATGIDATMILSSAAGPAQRTSLRDTYAAVWELSSEGKTRSEELVRLADAARARLSQTMPAHIAEVLQNAVVFARYSRIADELRRGVIIRVPDDVESFSTAISNRIDVDARGGIQNTIINNLNEQWAAEYLREEQAGNLPAKLRLLQGFTGVVERLSAEVLVDVAVRGSPDDARKAARQAVFNNLSSPELVNSFLRQQHRIPPTLENSLLLERICVTSLPSPRDPSWRLRVRQALVTRLLQLLASDGELAVLDLLAAELRIAYGRDDATVPRTTDSDPSPPAAGNQPAIPAGDTPDGAAARLARQMELEADRAVPTGREPMSLSRIILLHRQRQALARGPLQNFAAHQIAVADLLAYLAVAENPSLGPQVGELMQEMSTNRNKATHIIDQVYVVEETILRLWILRIDGQSPTAAEGAPP